MEKVPYHKKKRNSKGELTYRTKDKHHIEKIPRKLDIDDLVQIHREYNITPRVGMMPISCHLYDIDDPPTGWWIIHFSAFKIGKRCLFARTCLVSLIHLRSTLLKLIPMDGGLYVAINCY